jgi:hypothetical protein
VAPAAEAVFQLAYRIVQTDVMPYRQFLEMVATNVGAKHMKQKSRTDEI